MLSKKHPAKVDSADSQKSAARSLSPVAESGGRGGGERSSMRGRLQRQNSQGARIQTFAVDPALLEGDPDADLLVAIQAASEVARQNQSSRRRGSMSFGRSRQKSL